MGIQDLSILNTASDISDISLFPGISKRTPEASDSQSGTPLSILTAEQGTDSTSVDLDSEKPFSIFNVQCHKIKQYQGMK